MNASTTGCAITVPAFVVLATMTLVSRPLVRCRRPTQLRRIDFEVDQDRCDAALDLLERILKIYHPDPAAGSRTDMPSSGRPVHIATASTFSSEDFPTTTLRHRAD